MLEKKVFTYVTDGRPITSVDWCPQYKDLLLAAYAPSEVCALRSHRLR